MPHGRVCASSLGFFGSGAQLCSVLPSAGSPQPHILPRICPRGISLVPTPALLQPRWPMVTDGEAGGGIRGSFLRAPTQGMQQPGPPTLPVQGLPLGKLLADCEEQERVPPVASQL